MQHVPVCLMHLRTGYDPLRSDPMYGPALLPAPEANGARGARPDHSISRPSRVSSGAHSLHTL